MVQWVYLLWYSTSTAAVCYTYRSIKSISRWSVGVSRYLLEHPRKRVRDVPRIAVVLVVPQVVHHDLELGVAARPLGANHVERFLESRGAQVLGDTRPHLGQVGRLQDQREGVPRHEPSHPTVPPNGPRGHVADPLALLVEAPNDGLPVLEKVRRDDFFVSFRFLTNGKRMIATIARDRFGSSSSVRSGNITHAR